MVDEDLFSVLSGLLLGVKIEQDVIDESVGLIPRVWYCRSGLESPVFLGGQSVGFQITNFDIECMSETISQANNFAELVRTLNGFSGPFGLGYALDIVAEDQTDTYIWRNQWAAEAGFHCCGIRLKILA